VHFSLSGHIFSPFLQKCAPRSGRKHNFQSRYEAVLINKSFFRRQNRPGSPGLSYCWRTHAPLDPSKNSGKTNEISTFSLFGPTRPAHRGIKVAI
jgi:hypothetical protein